MDKIICHARRDSPEIPLDKCIPDNGHSACKACESPNKGPKNKQAAHTAAKTEPVPQKLAIDDLHDIIDSMIKDLITTIASDNFSTLLHIPEITSPVKMAEMIPIIWEKAQNHYLAKKYVAEAREIIDPEILREIIDNYGDKASDIICFALAWFKSPVLITETTIGKQYFDGLRKVLQRNTGRKKKLEKCKKIMGDGSCAVVRAINQELEKFKEVDQSPAKLYIAFHQLLNDPGFMEALQYYVFKARQGPQVKEYRDVLLCVIHEILKSQSPLSKERELLADVTKYYNVFFLNKFPQLGAFTPATPRIVEHAIHDLQG